MYFDGRSGLMIVAARQDCKRYFVGRNLFVATRHRFLASIAVDVHFEDRGVVHDAIDGGERHGGVTQLLMMPPFWIA